MMEQIHRAVPGAHDHPLAPTCRILILNWRDVCHPQAGGAERVTHEMARRWVTWGHHVTLLTAAYPGASERDCIDGVRVIRCGGQTTVHWEAFRQYRRCLRGRCDVIIDEVNTIPFFTPLYAREPVIMYNNQLAREVWRYEAPFPLSVMGYMAEPLYLQTYRRTPVMAISQSTADDLRELGLKGPCHIIPMATDTQPLVTLPSLETKEAELTLCFVGRLVPSKRVDHIIRALGRIHGAGHRDARLWLVGSWDEKYRRVLDRLAADLGLTDHVTFFGKVDAATKETLLAHAHLCVMTSAREGWGLVVTEANAVGTPAVVYDVPGLRDSTRDGETGIVCHENTPLSLARSILALHADRDLYARLRDRAWRATRELGWERTAREAWDVVERYRRPPLP